MWAYLGGWAMGFFEVTLGLFFWYTLDISWVCESSWGVCEFGSRYWIFGMYSNQVLHMYLHISLFFSFYLATFFFLP